MKKPRNKFAIVLWVSAVAVLVLNLTGIYEAYFGMRETFGHEGNNPGTIYFIYHNLIGAFGSTILGPAALMGIGALIELIDQIRWDRKPQQ